MFNNQYPFQQSSKIGYSSISSEPMEVNDDPVQVDVEPMKVDDEPMEVDG